MFQADAALIHDDSFLTYSPFMTILPFHSMLCNLCSWNIITWPKNQWMV